jgi:hypothetical protein
MRFGVSCGQLGSNVVLVGESAEDLFPADPVLGKVDRLGWTGIGLSRGELAEGLLCRLEGWRTRTQLGSFWGVCCLAACMASS